MFKLMDKHNCNFTLNIFYLNGEVGERFSPKLDIKAYWMVSELIFNPFKLNVFYHLNQLDESISNFRVVGHFYAKFKRNFCKQTVENLIRCHVLWHLIQFCTVCQCPTKRMLGLCGLMSHPQPRLYGDMSTV